MHAKPLTSYAARARIGETGKMVARGQWPYITPEEYLRREKDSDTKHEYIDGVVVAMSGVSDQHDGIANSIAGELYSRLRPAGCRGYTSNMRVRLNNSNRYYYPDYTIVCGKPKIEVLQGVDSLLNLSVIFELLSPSTERQDRSEKWTAYQRTESLTSYILVYQDQPHIEVFSRTSDSADWEFSEALELEATIHILPVGCHLALAQIYADVEFAQSGVTDPA